VDLPSHGESPADGAFSIGEAAEAVADLIEKVSPGRRVHLVGLSLGGQTALKLLSVHPELLERVIVSGTNISPSGGIRLMAPLLRFIMLLYGPIQNTSFMVHANMDQLKIPKQYEEEFRADTRRISVDLYVQIIVESMTFPLPHILNTSGLLVACGENEPDLIGKSARMIRGEHPEATCVVAPGVGHNWGMEKPELFSEMIRNWVERRALPAELQPLR
jgi:pimeloyl-ACP methyl ester carboxylesterase